MFVNCDRKRYDLPRYSSFEIVQTTPHCQTFPSIIKKKYAFCYLRAWFIIVTLLGGEFNPLINLEKKFHF